MPDYIYSHICATEENGGNASSKLYTQNNLDQKKENIIIWSLEELFLKMIFFLGFITQVQSVLEGK